VSNGATTGKVTLSQVCGVMTLSQITTALGYTPYNSSNPANYITASSLPATQQLAKAWVRFNGPGTSVPANGANVTNLISASYNISSLFYYDRNGWRAYFTAPFANASHLCGTGSSSGNNLAHNLVASVSFTTTYVQFYTPNGGNENVTSRLLPTGQTSFIVYSL
jgi:hypothetical protein